MKGFIKFPRKENLGCTCGLETNIKIPKKDGLQYGSSKIAEEGIEERLPGSF